MRQKLTLGKGGFTIIELMIATTVLSTMLVLVTAVMISIGNLYYKGVNQARVQDSVRTITESLAQDLEINASVPTTSSYDFGTFGPAGDIAMQAYCIGSIRYTYMIDVKIGSQRLDNNNNNVGGSSNPTFQHILWRDKISPSSCAPADLTASDPSASDSINPVPGSGGTELIPDNSRLTYFEVNNDPATNTSPYTLSVAVAFGDNDLTNGIGQGISTRCNGSTGDQFCATASLLNIVAVQRIN